MAASSNCRSSLKTPSSLVKPRLDANARPRFSNSSVTRRRCSRAFIHAWKTRNDTTIGTTDQNTRARKLVKPRNERDTVIPRLLDHVRGTRQNGLRNLQTELLRRLEIYRERHLPGVRVRNLGDRPSREDGLRQVSRLHADVLTAGERQREERAHLRVTVCEPEHRDLPGECEFEHLLDDGLGEDCLVGHDPQGVDATLKRLDRGGRLLRGGDLLRNELEPLFTGERLRLLHEIAGPRGVVDDADAFDARAELLEEADRLLDRDIHAGPGGVLATRSENARRVQDHGVDDR